MNSLGYILGFATGFVLVAIAALIAFKKFKRRPKFDERQQLLRSQAYQAAFWALVAYLCANGVFSMATGIDWADAMTSSFIGICIAITIFVVVCIQNDAYFAVNQQPRFYAILFSVMVAVNLALGIINVLDDDTTFITEGMLNYHTMSFVLVAMFIAVLAALAVQRIKARAHTETD